MPHGMLDPYFQKAESRRLKAWRNEIYWRLIESRNIQAADAVLFTCQEELLLARTTFKNYQPQKEINVGFGIPEVPNYEPIMKSAFLEKSGLKENDAYFLFLSRIHPKKGADIVINVYIQYLKNYKDKYNEMPLLVIAGPGIDTEYAQTLQDNVKSEQMDTKIIFTGMLSDHSKWGAFYGCESYWLCSHQENFGISVVEAMACSKPVLISNQINIWREIESEGAGIVCNDNAEDFHHTLKQWFEMSEHQKQGMSKNAKNAFQKHFNVQAATLKMLESIK